MKKALPLILITTMAMLTMISCKNKEVVDPLVGSWKSTSTTINVTTDNALINMAIAAFFNSSASTTTVEITFNADNTYTMSMTFAGQSNNSTGTYAKNDSQIYMTSANGDTQTLNYTLVDNTLQIASHEVDLSLYQAMLNVMLSQYIGDTPVNIESFSYSATLARQ